MVASSLAGTCLYMALNYPYIALYGIVYPGFVVLLGWITWVAASAYCTLKDKT